MKFLLRFIRKNWHWIFFGCVVVMTVGMDVFVANHILDGDASDFLNHAHIIARDHNPFTTDRYPTTEMRPLDLATVFSLFFYFTGDWSLVRILGSVLMQGLYVLAFLYLCRRAHIASRRVRVVSAALLLLPFSVPYARIVLYHLHYILYLTNAFWMLGLTLRLTECGTRREVFAPGCALGILWIFVGLNGIRHMMILGLPMLAFAAVQACGLLRRYRWEDGRLVGETAFSRTDTARLMWILAGSFVCFLIGFAVNVKLLMPVYGMTDTSVAAFYPAENAEHYARIFNGWLIASGVRCSNLPLIGTTGAALAAALFSFGYLLAVSAASFWEKGPVGPRLMKAMLASAFGTTTLIFVFESGFRVYELYYVPVAAFAIPTLAQELKKLGERAVSALRKLLIVLVCLCFVFQGAYTVYYLAVDRWDMDDWSGLSQTDLFLADTAAEYAGFMREAGYTHALTPYWYANVMMELTDGELTVAPLLFQEGGADAPCRVRLYRWGTSQTAFRRENLPDRLLAFIPAENAAQFERDFPNAPKLKAFESAIAYEISPDDIS